MQRKQKEENEAPDKSEKDPLLVSETLDGKGISSQFTFIETIANDDSKETSVPLRDFKSGKCSNEEHANGCSNDKPLTLDEMEIIYAPYVRHDAYGRFGTGEISWLEKARLMLALTTIVPLRLLLLVFILLLYYAICKLCTMFQPPSNGDSQENYGFIKGFRRCIVVRSGKLLARLMLLGLGFYWISVSERNFNHEATVDAKGSTLMVHNKEDSSRHSAAIVSNHVSYLDILYHMSACFPSFVAKKSVASLPFIGLISKCMGCIYVQRESKSSDSKGVSGTICGRLHAAAIDKDAPKMLLFPEGTTTNGRYLLSFKTGAFLSQAPVSPVILKYPYKRFSPAWDSISGTRHLLLLLCQVVNHLEVVRLPVYYPSSKEQANPKLYASNVRTLMATEGELIMSDVGLQEKRNYLAFLYGNQYDPQ